MFEDYLPKNFFPKSTFFQKFQFFHNSEFGEGDWEFFVILHKFQFDQISGRKQIHRTNSEDDDRNRM